MNTNPKAKRVLCFGDSNTWGWISGSNQERLQANKRWTGILQNILGNDFEIVEEGLSSRTINTNDMHPNHEGRNATDYIIPCLDSHNPLDWITIMLGTNEFKNRFNLTPENVCSNMENFLLKIINHLSQFQKIILIAPPLVNEQTEHCKINDKYLGATEKSKKISSLFENLAKKLDIKFLDSQKITEVGIDGVHLTENSHKNLALEIAKIIK